MFSKLALSEQLCKNQVLQHYADSLGKQLLVGRIPSQGFTNLGVIMRAITRRVNYGRMFSSRVSVIHSLGE